MPAQLFGSAAPSHSRSDIAMVGHRVILAAIALYGISLADSAPEIPPFLRVCRRSDPHLNECIKRSVDSLRPHLKLGIPALHIPPCEPLSVPQIELSQAAGPVSISSTYNNIKIWGGTDFILRSVKIDLDKERIRLKLYIPHLEMQANYNMEGKILMLPIMGQGLAVGNYTDIDVIVTIQGERYLNRQNQKTHFRVVEFYCDFDVGHASIHLDNLFNGDDTLADATNLFLNDNWKTVAAEVKPALEETVSKMFMNFSNKIYSKYPIDMLLPP